MRRPHLARTLRRLRLEKKLTLHELGVAAGLSPQYVQRLESSLQSPRFVVIEQLARALGVSVEAFARPSLLARAREDPKLVKQVAEVRLLERVWQLDAREVMADAAPAAGGAR